MPFASTSLGAEQPLLNSELLGYGRDPLAPIKDAVTADACAIKACIAGMGLPRLGPIARIDRVGLLEKGLQDVVDHHVVLLLQ